MKRIIYVIGLISLMWINQSCSEEGFTVFQGEKSGIYLQRVATTTITGTPVSYSDSLSFSFASLAEDVMELRQPIMVRIMGNVENYDRPYVLNVDEAKSTAIEGTHFTYDKNACVIKAGTPADTVWVTFYRHADLTDRNLRAEFYLESNDEFTVELEQYKNQAQWNEVGTEISGSRYKFIFSDQYSYTTWWAFYGDDYYGAWSVSKEKRLNQLMGWTHLDWVNWNVPYGRMAYAARMLQKELQQLADNGTPVIDDDGSYMQLGDNYRVDYSAYE